MGYIKNPVQVFTRKLPMSNPNFNINYPIVMGIENTNVQQKVNNRILQLVYKLIRDQIGSFSGDGTILPIQEMMGWYEIKANERGILSISIGNYTYPYRAAHGMTIIKSLTCNVETGEFYELEDMFKPDSNYVEVLSDMIEQQIKERDISLLDEFKGIQPNQDYYIADKCLVIYFQLYEIAAYVYGILCFPISVYEIEDIIKEGSPLDVLAIC